jgi:hypothetical protein
MPPIPMAEVLGAMKGLIGPKTRTFQEERIPGPSAVSIMAGLQDPIPSEDSLALGASTVAASAVEVSTAGAAEASMAVEAADSLER